MWESQLVYLSENEPLRRSAELMRSPPANSAEKRTMEENNSSNGVTKLRVTRSHG